MLNGFLACDRSGIFAAMQVNPCCCKKPNLSLIVLANELRSSCKHANHNAVSKVAQLPVVLRDSVIGGAIRRGHRHLRCILPANMKCLSVCLTPGLEILTQRV